MLVSLLGDAEVAELGLSAEAGLARAARLLWCAHGWLCVSLARPAVVA